MLIKVGQVIKMRNPHMGTVKQICRIHAIYTHTGGNDQKEDIIVYRYWSHNQWVWKAAPYSLLYEWNEWDKEPPTGEGFCVCSNCGHVIPYEELEEDTK